MIVTRVVWKAEIYLWGSFGMEKTYERRAWSPAMSVLSLPEYEISYVGEPYFNVYCLWGHKNYRLAGQTYCVPVQEARCWQMEPKPAGYEFDMNRGFHDPSLVGVEVPVVTPELDDKTPPVEPYPKPAVDMTGAELQRASVTTKGKPDPNWKKRR